MHALVGAVAHAPGLVQFLNEIVERALVLGRRRRLAAGAQSLDRLRFDAVFRGNRRMREPFNSSTYTLKMDLYIIFSEREFWRFIFRVDFIKLALVLLDGFRVYRWIRVIEVVE
jgi:hypothetical protein